MARRRRKNDLSLADLMLIFESRIAACLAMALGGAGIVGYYALEPHMGDGLSPMSSLPHAFWQAIAIRSFWPFLALLTLGACGFIVTTVKELLQTKS